MAWPPRCVGTRCTSRSPRSTADGSLVVVADRASRRCDARPPGWIGGRLVDRRLTPAPGARRGVMGALQSRRLDAAAGSSGSASTWPRSPRELTGPERPPLATRGRGRRAGRPGRALSASEGPSPTRAIAGRASPRARGDAGSAGYPRRPAPGERLFAAKARPSTSTTAAGASPRTTRPCPTERPAPRARPRGSRRTPCPPMRTA